jgi:hypothetical protein
LFTYYREAGRPTLRIIAGDIADNPKYDAFTASRETIRKMLRGQTIPPKWAVVNAVFSVLCARAAIGPDLPRGANRSTHRQHLRLLWNLALDAPVSSPRVVDGPGYPDEPPF